MNSKYINSILIFSGILGGIFFLEIFSFGLKSFLEIFFKKETEVFKSENIDPTKQNDDFFPYYFHAKFRLSRPLPYLNSTYFNWYMDQFWADDGKCQTVETHDGRGFNLKKNDIACKGFNIVNGWRVTKNQPLNPLQDIYIFGGSTVINMAVPNEFTIASYLQKRLNRINSQYKVNNRGFTTVTTNQQNEFLYKTDIKKGDIVIYYDGGNNQWQGVANNSPKGTIIGYNRNIRRKISIRKALSVTHTYKLLSFLKPKKKIIEDITPQKEYICEINYKNVFKKSNIAFDVYKKDLIDAAEFVSKNGGKFFHFYQPNLFSNKISELTPYERKLVNTSPSQMVPCGAAFYLENSSKIFTERHSELISSGIISTNISKIFSKNINPRLSNEEYFLDWIHVTERGNEIIADAIFKKIKNVLW